MIEKGLFQANCLGIVIPCYNEDKNLLTIIPLISGLLAREGIDYRIVIVDDCSKDNTWVVANSFKGEKVKAFRLDENLGKGAAIRQGIKLLNTEYLAFIDGDGDISAKFLVDGYRVLTNDTKIGCCVGSKRHVQSQVNYPYFRLLLSNIFSLYTRILFRIKIKDTQTGIKIFRKALLDDFIEKLTATGFAFDLELCVRMSRNGIEIVELPVLIDHSFESSVTLRSALQVLKDTLKLRMTLLFEKDAY
jgi:glycosyltransferase involved in cell wall biosynthesis